MADFEVIDPRTPPPEGTRNAIGPLAASGPRNDGSKGVGEVSDAKEAYASWIAQIITWTFAACAGVLLIGVFLVVLIRPAEAEALLSKAAIPAITQIGTFLSSVFGPLLAFVLGYYFGERRNKEG